MFDLKNLNTEYIANLNVEEILEIKDLEFNDKVKCFKFFLTEDNITNASILANIFSLVSDVTLLGDSLDTDPKFFFKSLEEYVDIKLECTEEIKAFSVKLLTYYLGIIEGLSIKLDELKVHIPNTYFNIIQIMSINYISKLAVKYLKNVDINKVKPVHCSELLYNKISNPESIVSDFMLKMISTLE